MASAYMSIKKLKGGGKMLAAARHNLREIQSELGAAGHIDARRSRLNVVMTGPQEAAEVAQLADSMMPSKTRRDAVRGLELVVSVPAAQAIDTAAFFADSLTWVRSFFNVPVLSAVVHHDEAEPHCHVLLLPIVAGRMIGSDLVGNRARLREMQASFFSTVALRYGLSRPLAAKRTSKAIRDKAARMALDALIAAPDCLDRPDVRLALAEAIAANPDALVAALGLSMPTAKATRKKSFVEIMTAPAKAEPKPIGFHRSTKPIGFQNAATPESEPYLCVGFANPSPHPQGTYARIHDEQDATLWDAESGEFREAPPMPGRVAHHH